MRMNECNFTKRVYESMIERRGVRERTVKGRQVMGALERVMKGRNVSMAVKKGIRNSLILPTLSYALETRTWNVAQKSQIRAVEMSYMRGVCSVSRWDRESMKQQ